MIKTCHVYEVGCNTDYIEMVSSNGRGFLTHRWIRMIFSLKEEKLSLKEERLSVVAIKLLRRIIHTDCSCKLYFIPQTIS